MASSKDYRSLMLLPPPPSPATYDTLKAAYHAPLVAVLRELSVEVSDENTETVLEIALPCPHLYGKDSAPRSTLYAPTQELLSGLYKLIRVISAKNSINIEDSQGIDVRVIMLSYPQNGIIRDMPSSSPETDAEGPVISIHALAHSNRKWNTIYSVESEAGEQLLRNMSSIVTFKSHVTKVRGGIVQISNEPERLTPRERGPDEQLCKHYSVAVGGTFDHLHIGHKLLLSMTAFMLDVEDEFPKTTKRTLTIGITGDELLKKKKYRELVEDWKTRQHVTDAYLQSVLNFAPLGRESIQEEEVNEPGPNGHAVHVMLPSKMIVTYVEIWDPFGPTITDPSISALVLSAETRAGGAAVNSKRGEKSWSLLEVFEVDVLDAQDEFQEGDSTEKGAQESYQSKLSSTEIRRKLSERTSARNKM